MVWVLHRWLCVPSPLYLTSCYLTFSDHEKSMQLSALILVLAAVSAVMCFNVRDGTVIMSGGALSFQDGINMQGVAFGSLKDTREMNGWSFLNMTTNSRYQDAIQALGVGYLEGFLSADQISDQFFNYHNAFVAQFKNGTVPPAILDYFMDHWTYLVDQTTKHRTSDPYWAAVYLRTKELEGLSKGYNDAPVAQEHPLSLLDLLMMTSEGDCYEIVPAVLSRVNQTHLLADALPDFEAFDLEAEKHHHFKTHCSAMITKTSDGNWAGGHTTWTKYAEMVRIYKTAEYNFSTGRSKYAYASKPGMLYSKDDYYVTDSGTLVMETTNSVMNTTLYQYVVPETVLTWLRVPLAIRTSSTPEGWFDVFKKHNSGTYCNQWMVLDTLKKDGAGNLLPGAFWVGEQIPGYVHAEDQTNKLNADGHWISYNIPFYKDVYEMSGYTNAYKKKGDAYSYTKCPRAKIFGAYAKDVTSVATLQNILRRNDPTDPLQEGDPTHAISSRYDLLPKGHPLRAPFGGIDTKVTSGAMLVEGRMGGVIQSGPTHDDVPAFDWSDGWDDAVTHKGQPVVWNFGWVDVGQK